MAYWRCKLETLPCLSIILRRLRSLRWMSKSMSPWRVCSWMKTMVLWPCQRCVPEVQCMWCGVQNLAGSKGVSLGSLTCLPTCRHRKMPVLTVMRPVPLTLRWLAMARLSFPSLCRSMAHWAQLHSRTRARRVTINLPAPPSQCLIATLGVCMGLARTAWARLTTTGQ